jgi:hypothetical protein
MRLRPQTVNFIRQFIITLVLLIILLAGTGGRFTLLSSRALFAGVLALAVLAIFVGGCAIGVFWRRRSILAGWPSSR